MNPTHQDSALTTADGAWRPDQASPPRSSRPGRLTEAQDRQNAPHSGDRELVALFKPDLAEDFRLRWDAVQGTFVDDPRGAVRRGDELVAQVIKSLADSFANERAQLEGQLDRKDEAATENLATGASPLSLVL